MAAKYWIRSGGRESGPFDSAQVRQLAAQGRLARTDSVSADRVRWIAAESISGLQFSDRPSGIVPRQDATAALAKRLVVADQPEDVIAGALERVRSLCIVGEEVRYIAVQRKPIVTLTPDSLAITTRRLIYLETGVLGRAKVHDWIWRDVADVSITEGIVGATVQVRLANGGHFSVDYIPKESARALYRLAQEQEEVALEERRARAMEESRARAGGVNILNGTPGPQQLQPTRGDPIESLKRLKQMHEEGLITDAEYQSKRAEIVARM